MKRRIAILLLSAILPLVIAGSLWDAISAANWRSGIRRNAIDRADAVSTLVSRELAADGRAALMLAQSPAFDGSLDRARLSELASRLAAQEPLWRAISITDSKGVRLLDAPHAIGGAPHGLAVDLQSQQRAFKTGRLVVGKLLIGRAGRAAFAVRAPVVRDGRVRYVVSIIMQPSNFRELLTAGGLPSHWRIALLDEAGTVVAATDLAPGSRLSPSESAGSVRGGSDFQRETAGSGQQQLAIWQPTGPDGWKIQVAVPMAVYDRPVVMAITQIGFAILAVSCLVVLFVWLLARELSREAERHAAAVEAQRLELLGRMTGGVAHDFNNLLMPIIGGLDLLQRRFAPDPRAARLIDGCLKSAERAKALVAHLLAFARKQSLQPVDVDVTRLIEGLADLLEHSVGKDISLRLRLDADLPSAKVDPVQLEIALLNLAVNARDAMPTGGQLTIEARGDAAPTNEGRIGAGRFVKISVSDTGSGMDPATLKLATEPFFTTKPPGSGTGLGLSMVHGLAAQSGGALKLQSTSGVGTRAELWLPVGGQQFQARLETPEEIGDATGRLLLVDDDDLVRGALAAMLRDGGHEVTEANSPAVALDLVQSDAPIDLIVTDFAMPRMNGLQLIEEARKLRPDQRALIITGYANLIGEAPPDIDLLHKPFRQGELLGRIAAQLLEPVGIVRRVS